jgi:hypothetical protein
MGSGPLGYCYNKLVLYIKLFFRYVNCNRVPQCRHCILSFYCTPSREIIEVLAKMWLVSKIEKVINLIK